MSRVHYRNLKEWTLKKSWIHLSAVQKSRVGSEHVWSTFKESRDRVQASMVQQRSLKYEYTTGFSSWHEWVYNTSQESRVDSKGF